MTTKPIELCSECGRPLFKGQTCVSIGPLMGEYFEIHSGCYKPNEHQLRKPIKDEDSAGSLKPRASVDGGSIPAPSMSKDEQEFEEWWNEFERPARALCGPNETAKIAAWGAWQAARSKSKSPDRVSITFEKGVLVDVLSLIEVENPICEYYKEPITIENTGGFQKLDKIRGFCNSPLCIAEHLDFEEEYKTKPTPTQPSEHEISLCPSCNCMTKTIIFDKRLWCGKCKEPKETQPSDLLRPSGAEGSSAVAAEGMEDDQKEKEAHEIICAIADHEQSDRSIGMMYDEYFFGEESHDGPNTRIAVTKALQNRDILRDVTIIEKAHHDTLNSKMPKLFHAGCDDCVDKTVVSVGWLTEHDKQIEKRARIDELKKLLKPIGEFRRFSFDNIREHIKQLEAGN